MGAYPGPGNRLILGEIMNQSAPELLYGVAYYLEYLPYDRLDEDIRMMKAAGITVVRIAESTWSTLEPQSGVFDFSFVDRVLDAMHAAGIRVIVGTPTYAVPTWLARLHPEVLAVTAAGPNRYGPRQNMDITSPAYLWHCERVIRALCAHVAGHPAVIGWQADNETKYHGTAGPNVQKAFVTHCKAKFPSLEALNDAWGLAYWSNRINAWEDFPETHASINFSLTSEFAAFQRSLVTDFLAWQVKLIKEYARPGHFVTQNFDFEWRGHSFGVQPSVDHFAAARAFDVAGVDIYHPSQDQLTGAEIAFGGDLARSLKRKNYLVLETEAQAFATWVPFPGQLRLQAFSHVASGASMVAYWHWHSIHNSFETYWKGLLSHDFSPNPTYLEAQTIGADFARLGPVLGDLKVSTKVAMVVSNRSLTALNAFKMFQAGLDYNDVVRRFYDELYHLSVCVDMIDAEDASFDGYAVVVVPSLYSAPDALLDQLAAFVRSGGHVVWGPRSGWSDEHVKVRSTAQPGRIAEVCGASYSQFVAADSVGLTGLPFALDAEGTRVTSLAELLVPEGAEVLARYDHPHWKAYAAVTKHRAGKGTSTYFGCVPPAAVVQGLLAGVLKVAGVWTGAQELGWPVVTKAGTNAGGRTVRFYFNYSGQTRTVRPLAAGRDLLTGAAHTTEPLDLAPWGFTILEETR